MPCNLSKRKELVLKKKWRANPTPTGNIKQAEFLVLLGVTFQHNGRFTEGIILNDDFSKRISDSTF